MAEQVIEQQTVTTPVPAAEPSAPITQQVSEVKEQDLITKVAQFQKAQTQKPATYDPNDIGFDYKEIESIKDPIAKEIAIKAYKSMQAGVTKKFQEVALTRKDLETKIADMQTWTPEKVNNYLLNNPSFLQAAQQIAGQNTQQNPNNGGLTDEQYSALTDREKAELAQLPTLKDEINKLKQVNIHAILAQVDSQLQTKYSDYNPSAINNGLSELSRLQPHELREVAYKALNHDEHVKAAYEMGRQEALQLNQTRVNFVSVNGSQAVNNDGLPTRAAGENDRTWFERLANFRIAQSRKK